MSPGSRYIALVIGLLALSVGTCVALLAFATRDPGFALERDYYRKAIDFDRIRAEEEASAKLGWSVAVTLPRVGEHDLKLLVLDAERRPVIGAIGTVEAFATARSAAARAEPLEELGDGEYRAVVPVERGGLWEVRLRLERGGEVFRETRRLELPAVPHATRAAPASPPSPLTVPALVTVLGASFAGSAHCGAMCGGLAAFAAGTGMGSLAYHAGRLASYVALGALAGALGVGVGKAGDALGLSDLASLVAGLLMIGFGLSKLLAPERLPHLRLPFGRALSRVVARFERSPRSLRALSFGLSTTLIPCGWLYAFVIAAGGTGTPLGGAALMAVFWAGTLPILSGIGALTARAWAPLARAKPILSAAALILIGALSLAEKLPVAKEPVCHGGRASAL